ncbi:MAG: hypothetical protein E6Q97_08895 [Desulfurellales bacterium]|nr:MAG: hypothetical protein E6Q97_08895 [Desulfurellales bacterium]
MQLEINGQQYTLLPMRGEQLVKWADINLLAAAQKAQAVAYVQESGEERLREALRLVYLAGGLLCKEALGCSDEVACNLTMDEQRLVIESQERLNKSELLWAQLPVEKLVGAQ